MLAAQEDAPHYSTEEARQDDRREGPPAQAAQRRLHRLKLMRRARLLINVLKASDLAGKDKGEEIHELAIIKAGLALMTPKPSRKKQELTAAKEDRDRDGSADGSTRESSREI